MGTACSSCSRLTSQNDEMDVSGDTVTMREEEVMKIPASAKAQEEDMTQQLGHKKGHAHINLKGNETILVAEQGMTAPASRPSKRAKDRKGTGFVTRQDIEQAGHSSDEEEEESKANGKTRVSFEAGSADAAKRSGRISDRKPTGAITKDKLLQAMMNEEDEEEDEDDNEPEGEAATAVPGTVNGAAGAPPQKPLARKATGWVGNMKKKLSGQKPQT